MNDQMDAAMAKPVDLYVAQLKTGPNTKGVGNQPLVPKVLAERHEGVPPHRRARQLGSLTRQDRAGVDVQRHRARTRRSR